MLRNKLTAHGQGAEVVTVSLEYALLAVQLAAALNGFLIAKHVRKCGKPRETEEDLNLPF